MKLMIRFLIAGPLNVENCKPRSRPQPQQSTKTQISNPKTQETKNVELFNFFSLTFNFITFSFITFTFVFINSKYSRHFKYSRHLFKL